MDTSKTIFTLIYAFIGLYIGFGCSPYKNFSYLFKGIVNQFKKLLFINNILLNNKAIKDSSKYLLIIFLSLLSFVLLGKQSITLAITLIIIFILINTFNRKYTENVIFLFGTSIGCLFPFWHFKEWSEDLNLLHVFSFCLLYFFLFFLVYFSTKKNFNESTKNYKKRNLIYWLLFILFVLFLYIIAPTVLINTDSASPWHHWGVYISSSRLLLTGAVPLYDFPMQYGLGPTLLVSVGCEYDCFASLSIASSISNILLVILCSFITFKLVKPKNSIQTFLILLFFFMLILVPMSAPGDVNAPNAYPSGNGLRFLPGVLMLSFLIFLREKLFFLGHFLWVISFIWSPEAGIHATVLWVPFYVLTQLKIDNNKNKYLFILTMSFLKLSLYFLIYLILFLFAFYYIYNEIPELKVYLTYYLNPVGIYGLKFVGPFLIILSISILWIYWNNGIFKKSNRLITTNINIQTNTWLIALLAYANFSYCIGRSADGNMGVVIIYFGILLFIIYRYTNNINLQIFTSTLIAAIISWSFFPGTMQNYSRAFQDIFLKNYEESINFPSNNSTGIKSPYSIKDFFDRSENSTNFYYRASLEDDKKAIRDAINARLWINKNFNEPIDNYDHHLVDSKQIDSAWNGIHGPANYGFIKSEFKRLFISRVKQRLKKTGWIIYDNRKDKLFIGPQGYISDYITDLEMFYNKTHEKKFGHITAVRFVPK